MEHSPDAGDRTADNRAMSRFERAIPGGDPVEIGLLRGAFRLRELAVEDSMTNGRPAAADRILTMSSVQGCQALPSRKSCSPVHALPAPGSPHPGRGRNFRTSK
jgi:hypothetical protein